MREIGQFLAKMRSLGLLARLPLSYDIKLSQGELQTIRFNPIPHEKFAQKHGNGSQPTKKKKKKRKSTAKRRPSLIFTGGFESNRRRH